MKFKHLLFIVLLLTFIKVNASSIEVNTWQELESAINENYDEIILKKGDDFSPSSTITINSKTVNIKPESGKIINIYRFDFPNELFKIEGNSTVTIGDENGIIIFSVGSRDQVVTKNYITVNDSFLNIKNTEFYSSNATNTKGGALYIKNSTVNISDANFNSNNGKFGGAIYVDTASTVNVNGSTFNENTASNSGGAIYAYGTLHVNNSTFTYNVANTHGGGIMAKEKAIVTASTFDGNVATTKSGGAIRVDGNLEILDSVLKNNTAFECGAGIDYRAGLLIKNQDNTFQNNHTGETPIDIYPDPESENNIDWKKDLRLNIKEIDVTILKTFKKDGTTELPVFTGSTQGFTVAGDYLIFATRATDEDPTLIHVLNKGTLEYVKTNTLENTSNQYNLGHANDFAYDKNTGYIYAYAYRKDENNNPLAVKFKLDSSGTITNLEYFIVPISFSGIAIDSENNRFILLSSEKVYIYDQNFELINSFNTPSDLTSQGIGYYKGYVYYSNYEAGYETQYQTKFNVNEKGSNLVYMYDLEGHLIKTLYIPNTKIRGEIESVSFLDNGELLMNYNYDGVTILKSTYLTQVKKVEIEKLPSKLQYNQGDELDLEGLVLKVTYNNETSTTTSDISNLVIDGFNTENNGNQTVSLYYKGQEVTFDVEVVKVENSNNNNQEIDKNPKTGILDYTIIFISLIVISIVSLLVLTKNNKIL